MRHILCLFCICCLMQAKAQTLTPVNNAGTYKAQVEVPFEFTAMFPPGKTLTIPVGYKVRVYYMGSELQKPRFMSFDSSGTLYFADQAAGKVYALHDTDSDRTADTAVLAASGFTNSHDVKFYKGDMYVTETTRIWKCSDSDKDSFYETKSIFIDNIGNGSTSGHVTRTLVFDTINQKVYVSVGSSCNVCRETNRAIIEQYDIDGTNRRIFATGIRNAVGMTLHPVTNKLWANNNGSDNQGNEIPPEWIDIVRDNGFYGHPFAYAGPSWFNFNLGADYMNLKPITANDSARVNAMVYPAALVRAHSAPMAITFLNGSFPQTWNKGFITALRGSWNSTNPKAYRGYKVIYAHLDDDGDSTVDYISDFASGFLTDSINQVYWGRPVGLAADDEGNVYISSDEGEKFILQMYPENNTGLGKIEKPVYLNAYPNPVNEELNIRTNSDDIIYIYDMNGVLIFKGKAEDGGITVDTGSWAAGIYLVKSKRASVKVVKSQSK